MAPLIAWYREFLPSRALEADVYSFFSFVPAPAAAMPRRPLLREIAFHEATFCSPQFADGHVSIVFELGHTCREDGRWRSDSTAWGGTVIGPMSSVGRTAGDERPEMLGVYLRPGRVAPFLHVAISELADRALAVDDVWGSEGGRLPHELAELDEAGRIERLEAVLLEHAARSRPRHEAVDVEGLAASVQRRQGRVTVEGLARAAGVSRQHLSRRFRERIGISPKLYARLARFHAGLGFAGARASVDWAGVALDMGYADQSHMIAEFRQFSGLTPHTLATGSWFHPFIERSRRGPARRGPRG